jgi:hypothetical protein
MMDEQIQQLLIQRRALSRQMLAADPGSDEMQALLRQESLIAAEIKARMGQDKSVEDLYGIAYGVLANGQSTV